MRIAKHEESYIVGLEDGSEWRIWPGDLATTLLWMPSSRFAVSETECGYCTHTLVDSLSGRAVRAIKASAAWTPENVSQLG